MKSSRCFLSGIICPIKISEPKIRKLTRHSQTESRPARLGQDFFSMNKNWHFINRSTP